MKVKEASSLLHKRVNGTSAVCGIFRKLSFACLLAIVAQGAYAYDFEADGIYYNYLDKEQHTLEVTYKNTDYNSYSGKVTIPKHVYRGNVEYSVTSIGRYAFELCSKLTSVVIPEGVTSIGYCSFAYGNVSSITIPEGVTSLGDGCFRECKRLTSVALPSSITSIPNDCFNSCTALTSVLIPESVTSLGSSCFAYSGLTTIAIPASVTSLGSMCFFGCSNLTSVSIPEGVTSLSYDCFRNCGNLTSVTIPASVTSLGGECFKNCSGLKDVYILSDANCSIGKDAFNGVTDANFHVPYGKKSYYTEISALSDQTIKECYLISVSKAQYGTFYIGAPFIMPEGLKGGIITKVADDGVLTIDYLYTAGKTVPAGTGLLLYTDNTDGFSQLVDMEDANEETAPTDNLLRGSDVEEETTGGERYYMLSYDAATKSKLGFWWGAEDGAAFTNGAHKAYLALSGNSEVKGFSLDDLASGISNVSRENGGTEAVKSVYTIDGRRLKAQSADALPAGIYIVNGKKVAVR